MRAVHAAVKYQGMFENRSRRHEEADDRAAFGNESASLPRRLRGFGSFRTRSRNPRSGPAILRWLPAPALALLAVGGLWWSFTRPAHDPAPLAAGAAALEQSREFTQNAPGAVLAPLSEEMEHLNRDVRHAVEFLVASVP